MEERGELPRRAEPVAARDDAELVDRLRRGEAAAFAEVVGRWSSMMLRVARTYVSTDASAQEIGPDTWMAVVRGLNRSEGRSSLRTWVFRILTNLAKTRGARGPHHAVVLPGCDRGGPADRGPRALRGSGGARRGARPGPGEAARRAGGPLPWSRERADVMTGSTVPQGGEIRCQQVLELVPRLPRAAVTAVSSTPPAVRARRNSDVDPARPGTLRRPAARRLPTLHRPGSPHRSRLRRPPRTPARSS